MSNWLLLNKNSIDILYQMDFQADKYKYIFTVIHIKNCSQLVWILDHRKKKSIYKEKLFK